MLQPTQQEQQKQPDPTQAEEAVENPTEQVKDKNIPEEPNQMSVEEQEQFDLFVINGMNIIYDGKMAENIITKTMHAQDPIQGIADALVEIVKRLVGSARQNGMQIKQAVLIHGSNVLLGELLRLLESAGMESLTEEQKVSCWQIAVSIYINQGVQSGKIKKDTLVTNAQMVKQTEQGKQILKTARQPEFNGSQPNGGQPNE